MGPEQLGALPQGMQRVRGQRFLHADRRRRRVGRLNGEGNVTHDFEHDGILHRWVHPDTGVSIDCQDMPGELMVETEVTG